MDGKRQPDPETVNGTEGSERREVDGSGGVVVGAAGKEGLTAG